MFEKIAFIKWNSKLETLGWSNNGNFVKNESSKLHGQSLNLFVWNCGSHLRYMLFVDNLVVVIKSTCLELLNNSFLEFRELGSNEDHCVAKDLLFFWLLTLTLLSLLLATSLLCLVK